MIFTLLISLFLLFPKQVQAQNWEVSGLPEGRIQTLETTPWGIVAGEYDTRLWLLPNNGLYISKNLGNSWYPLGLAGRGITDIAYSDGKIYATTYYVQEEETGLFVSADAGISWSHLGNNVSSSSVSAQENIILQGTYSHGLWISKDSGETWEQVLGEGFFGPEIMETAASNEVLIASTINETYISLDKGFSWVESLALKGKHVKNIEIVNNIVFAGTTNNDGLFKSSNSGKTWTNLTSWGESSVGGIEYFQNNLYASKEVSEVFDIFYSPDFGETWFPTNLSSQYNEGHAYDIASAFSNPSYLFTTIPIEGIYRKPFTKPPVENHALFDIPWNASTPNELIERLYSYFDHKYPLINYPYHSESSEDKATTVNFLGIEKTEPEMYYSGHDGIDFALDYGTPVLAVASGEVSYEWSNIRGHTMRVDHQNGYITEYSHLQETGLIETPLWVESGTTIGLVGNTGISTGAHLHFSVNKNEKKTDPFGWQVDGTKDPWATYVWSDVLGANSGTTSKYLWKEFPEIVATYIDHNGGNVTLNNKSIIIDQNSGRPGFTVFVEPYEYPKVPISQDKLTYITGTSILVNLYNILGEKVPTLVKPVKIEMDFSNADLEDILQNTISFYFFNEEDKMWEEVDSIYDVATKRLTGESYHFSHFAIFGERIIKSLHVTGLYFEII